MVYSMVLDHIDEVVTPDPIEFNQLTMLQLLALERVITGQKFSTPALATLARQQVSGCHNTPASQFQLMTALLWDRVYSVKLIHNTSTQLFEIAVGQYAITGLEPISAVARYHVYRRCIALSSAAISLPPP